MLWNEFMVAKLVCLRKQSNYGLCRYDIAVKSLINQQIPGGGGHHLFRVLIVLHPSAEARNGSPRRAVMCDARRVAADLPRCRMGSEILQCSVPTDLFWAENCWRCAQLFQWVLQLWGRMWRACALCWLQRSTVTPTTTGSGSHWITAYRHCMRSHLVVWMHTTYSWTNPT